MQDRLDNAPEMMRVRRQTVEHPFGTIKSWMGATHFLTKTLDRVSTEMSLHVLAYNLKRVMKLLGIGALIDAVKACGLFLRSIRSFLKPIALALRAHLENAICTVGFVKTLAQSA